MKKATRQQTKIHNTQLILKTIYDQHEISRADIARKTHLTRTTVSDVVSELIQDGLVAEIRQGPSAGGRRPILISIADDSRHMLGIDLASHVFRGATINLRGQIRHRLHLAVRNLDGKQSLERVYALIDGLLAVADKPLLGIGIGSPGLSNAQNGVVINSVNLDWHQLPLRDLLEARYDLPVYMANDCQVAALGEFTFGENKLRTNLILIKVGRGIGAGIILNQQLYFGDGGYGAGEIGHITMVDDGELCLCGHRGCLETLASSTALLRVAKHAAQTYPTSLLNSPKQTADIITLETIQHALEQKDPVAQSIVEKAGKYLGQAIASVVCTLGIRSVVIGGSVAGLGTYLTKSIEQQLQRCALATLAKETDISITHLGTDIVMLGAAALVSSEQLGI